MSEICAMKIFNHKRDNQGHVMHGQGFYSCLIDNRPCTWDQDNETCPNAGYAEKNDHEAASEYLELGSPYIKGACKKPCAHPCGSYRQPNCSGEIWMY